jgi:hypothetical protein
MPLDIRRYKYEHSNHGVYSQAENRTTNKRNEKGRNKTEEKKKKRGAMKG